MTIKRLILAVLTILAVLQVSLSLIDSWNQPQIQSRLELYQTNLLLHAAEWQDEKPSSNGEDKSALTVRDAIIGENPFAAAQKQYQGKNK